MISGRTTKHAGLWGGNFVGLYFSHPSGHPPRFDVCAFSLNSRITSGRKNRTNFPRNRTGVISLVGHHVYPVRRRQSFRLFASVSPGHPPSAPTPSALEKCPFSCSRTEVSTPEDFLRAFLRERDLAYAGVNERLSAVHTKYFGEPLSQHAAEFLLHDRANVHTPNHQPSTRRFRPRP
jgi:hypothetical protein